MIANRRQYSVSSILMFIFNIFLTEQGITEVPVKKVLPILSPFGKNETAIRMGLSRAVQSGLLANIKVNGEVYYQLTPEGNKALLFWRQTLENFKDNINRQKQPWNGQWVLALVKDYDGDGPHNTMRDNLTEHRFRSWGRDLWLSPYEVKGDFKAAGLLLMKAQPTDGVNDLDLASSIWPITELIDRYQSYLNALNSKAKIIFRTAPTTEAILSFLYTFCTDLFSIISDDPQLPLAILPDDWPGIIAFETFHSIRQELLPIAREYISKILN